MTADSASMPTRARREAAPGILTPWLRQLLHARLAGIRDGAARLHEGGRSRDFGASDSDLRASIEVRDPAFYRALAARGSIGGAESYIDGHWRSDDLAALLRIVARNRTLWQGLDGGLARWWRPLLALEHARRDNDRAGSRRNIAAHYDLGNEFFECFLDPTLAYSCGIFESEVSTMEQASIAKFDRICRKLALRPGDSLLEIGAGWGGFALHAARDYGCRVTTTTISQRQYERTRERVREAGLQDRIEVLCEDYRDLRGSFDKLVSIEMVEAVGHRHLDEFLRVCGERLEPRGSALIQAITVSDQEVEAHRRSVDFIKRYIFPGGELVSPGTLIAAASRTSDLRAVHLEDITPHYAETLRRWRQRLEAQRRRVLALGLDEHFLRMWEFYLAYCEAGFEEREIGCIQLVFDRAGARREPVLGRLDAGARGRSAGNPIAAAEPRAA